MMEGLISLSHLIREITIRRNSMLRTVRISTSVLFFLLGSLFVVANATPLHAVFGFIVAAIALYLFFVFTNGFFTGFLEDLNTNIASTIATTEDLFNSANQSIKIVSGCLYEKVYFNPDVFQALKVAKEERKVNIEIIIAEPNVTLEHLRQVRSKEIDEFLSWVERGEISLKKVIRKRVRPHFIVVDGFHVRVEEKHPKRKPGEEVSKRRAKVTFLNPIVGKNYEERFEKFKQEVVALIPQST